MARKSKKDKPISMARARRIQDSRKPKAIETDGRLKAKAVYKTPNQAWASHPNRSDVKGIDLPGRGGQYTNTKTQPKATRKDHKIVSKKGSDEGKGKHSRPRTRPVKPKKPKASKKKLTGRRGVRSSIPPSGPSSPKRKKRGWFEKRPKPEKPAPKHSVAARKGHRKAGRVGDHQTTPGPRGKPATAETKAAQVAKRKRLRDKRLAREEKKQQAKVKATKKKEERQAKVTAKKDKEARKSRKSGKTKEKVGPIKSRRRPELAARKRSEFARRREARKAVRNSTGIRNPIVLNQLINEAEGRQLSYDEVDWDLIQGLDLSMTERRLILTENYGPTRKEQIDAATFQEQELQRKQEARTKADEKPVTEAQAQDEAARFFSGLERGRVTVG